jgi:hypothetical protein
MKRVITAVFCAALTTASLPAQELKVRANVPFAFHVCNRLLPQGQYEIERKTGALVVSDPDRRTSICFVLANSGIDPKAGQPGRLVFDHVGSQYFLRSVWDGSSSGQELPASSQEKELIARVKATDGQKTVLALSRK